MDGSRFNRFNPYKLLVHADRLRKIAAGEFPFPVDWHIYPSNHCNHTCRWCIFRQNGEQVSHPEQLSRDLMLRAVGDAARTGARLVHFSGGGEPLLNPHTPEAARLAIALGLSVALSTNGTYLSPEIAAVTDFVRVSVNAGTKEEHDSTNHPHDPRSDWETVIQNIKEAVHHRRKDFGLAFVADHENWGDIYPFCSLAAEIGVDFVQIRPAFWYDRSLDTLTRETMPLVGQETERARKDFGQRLEIFASDDMFKGFWTPRTYSCCRAILTGTCLTATGDFAVCQDRTDLRFGHAYKEGRTFEDIWLSDEHRALVVSIRSPGILNTCPRCVWNNRNEIIEEMFVKDRTRLDLV